MGQPVIRRNRAKEQVRQLRRLKQEGRISPADRSVTVIQDERTREVLGVAVSREAAGRFRAKLAGRGDSAELIDFGIEV